MTHAAWVGVAAAFVAGAPPLAAQHAALRLGGVRATYADTLSGSAGTVGGELGWTSPRARGALGATFAQFTSGAWAAQASLTGAALVRGAVGAFADGGTSALEDGTWSATGSGGVFAAVTRGAVLVSAGVGAGAVRRTDWTRDPLVTGTARLRVGGEPWSVEGVVTGTRAGSVEFADATLGAQVATTAFRLGALVGARAGDLSRDVWVQGRAELQLGPFAALEVAGGGYPRDVTGFVGGAYVSAGLRLALRRSGGTGASARPVRAPEPVVALVRVAPLEVRLTVRAGDAHSLAVAGEWNGWTPQPLEPLGDGRWSVVLPFGPGAYRFALVADGERWYVPPGVPTLPDEFGGNSGVLLVGN